MKKNPWLVTGIVLLVIVACLAVGAKFLLPGLIKNKVVEAVKKGCPDCALFIKTVDVSLLHPAHVEFHDVRFAGGEGGHALVEARFKDLNMDLALGKTNGENLVFDFIEINDPEFIYADGDAPKRPKPESDDKGDLKVGVYEAHIQNALFRYAHTKDKKTSILHFQKITADLKNAGNTQDLVDKMAEAHITGQIEKSGHGDLQIAALLRPGPWYVDVMLNLDNQNLEDLNAFFTPNDGVVLKGEMLHALANLNVRDESTKTHVEATYKNAEFKETATKERGAVEAGLATFGASLMMNKTNTDRLPIDRMTELQVPHNKGEPLVHYLLRSSKLGLLDVAKKPDSRKKK